MNQAEQLAKLNAKVSRLDPRVDGGRAIIEASDLSMILAKLGNPRVAMLARVAYLVQMEWLAPLLRGYILHEALDIAMAGKWVDQQQFHTDLIRDFCQMAIFEIASDNGRHCSACGGRGQRPVKKAKTENQYILSDCNICAGTGAGSIADEIRAECLGFKYSAWRGGWRDRYNRILMIVRNHDTLIQTTTARELKALRGAITE